jgi:hypothetical protein
MSITNIDYIKSTITNNISRKLDVNENPYTEFTPTKYRWTHGATDFHMGDGILVYSAIQYMRAKVCVCLGSGGGFIPRIMTQARRDLHEQGIFEGDNNHNWGDIGTTILVDASNGIGGYTDWNEGDSFLRKHFFPRIIEDTTENAYYNFFIKEDIKIDYLHIDAGHSYEDVKRDFDLYSTILSENGIISIHDTDTSFEKDLIITKDVTDQNHHDSFDGPGKFIEEIQKNNDWEVFNFFNNRVLKTKPASTGLTFIQKCKK